LARYYANPKRNIEYFSDIVKKQRYVFKQAAEYGLALSYLANEEFQPALKLIDGLLLKDPDNLFYLDTYTDIAIEMKQHQKAIDRLSAQLVHTPYNRVLTLNLANVLIKTGEIDRATSLLKDYLLINPDNMLAYEILVDAYRTSEQQLEMHQVKAEVFALVAAYPRAIDELHTAYNYADKRNLEKQRIRARIEQFRTAQERLQTL
jgi:predicted Zn-dependent protease